MKASDLIGRFYPIKDFISGEIVAYERISEAKDLQDSIGYYIELHRSKNSGLVIEYSDGYHKIREIVKKEET